MGLVLGSFRSMSRNLVSVVAMTVFVMWVAEAQASFDIGDLGGGTETPGGGGWGAP